MRSGAFQERADITTRQNLQLRGSGLRIPDIFNRLLQAGMTCVQSGMDTCPNITVTVAGIDADELLIRAA